MEITEIRVFPVDEEKLKAFVSVVFDGCFIVSDIKIINGNNGLFLSMPSKKGRSGKFRDIAHPLNSEMRGKMERAIIEEYHQVLREGGAERADPVRVIAGEQSIARPAEEEPPPEELVDETEELVDETEELQGEEGLSTS